MLLVSSLASAVLLPRLQPTVAAESKPVTPPPSASEQTKRGRLLAAKKPFVPTEQYEVREMRGWTLRVNKDLLETKAAVAEKALSLLDTKLEEICRLLPETPLAKLKTVPIWVGVDDYALPNATYHPSAEWLRNHGWNPDKAGGVEISNAAVFVEWSTTQPMIVLHELAHAFHHQVLGHTHPGVRAAFKRARASGRYEQVRHANGRMQRAYALNNEQEFFAEATEAFFGRNDFEPFTRQELREFDPETYALLEDVWSEPAAGE